MNSREKNGYRYGISIDVQERLIERGTVEEVQRVLTGWAQEGGTIAAHCTVEAGCVPEFLRDPWVKGYLEIKAKLAIFCQRKIDAIRIESEIKRRIFRQ